MRPRASRNYFHPRPPRNSCLLSSLGVEPWQSACSMICCDTEIPMKGHRRNMGEDRKASHIRPEDVIAAFDRERAEARELHRRHGEHVRASRAHDRPAPSDHHKGQQ
jgi:hypothetical protein